MEGVHLKIDRTFYSSDGDLMSHELNGKHCISPLTKSMNTVGSRTSVNTIIIIRASAGLHIFTSVELLLHLIEKNKTF